MSDFLKLGEFEDFRNAETAKAIISADSIEELLDKLNLPFQNISETFEYCTIKLKKERLINLVVYFP